MSNNKMLIDAAHPEETRVVVLRDGRVEEFDYESAARKLLRGNIYLAKVTRVEPSLQAAFVDYGGNRHGFLAFNEIHPDYYQIPIADRELLKQEEAEAEAEAEAAAEARAERRAKQQEERRERARKAAEARAAAKAETAEEGAAESGDTSTAATAAAEATRHAMAVAIDDTDDVRQEPAGDADETIETDAEAGTGTGTRADAAEAGSVQDDAPHEIGLVEQQGVDNGDIPAAAEAAADDTGSEPDMDGSEIDTSEIKLDDEDDTGDDSDDANGTDDDPVEEVGSEDALEEIAERPRRRARQYKIQEVIKRRQVLLVQVVKEERGNKGAALTTYLSLAGRYTVLMPNTGRGGGISRKISNAADRKRLKAIASELDVPEGMGLIIRTAGATRTKAEIQRDFEYLLRLWESVRELTLESSAPNLVYEEGNLIKRSIRDLYTKEIDEVLVAGEHSHEEAKEFMAMLMPSHAKNVVAYNQPEPLFAKYQIERQLNAMFSPYVTLRSGGYIVINQTEALVSVDVNSGKATREFSIEQTALKTNLEAAEELGRQLKLRDLAGLIVIDFIDMEERRNNRAVERKIKECLKNDRARIQVGRISHFGLLEMSRQRMRTGVLEGSTTQCPHCAGTGTIRSTESVALAVLRALEDALLGNSTNSLTAVTTATVGLYILNYKRSFINEMEDRYGIAITIEASERMQGANFSIEKSASQVAPKRRPQTGAVNMETGFSAQSESSTQVEKRAGEDGNAGESDGDQKKPRKRRRRRGGRGGRAEGENRATEAEGEHSAEGANVATNGADQDPAAASEVSGGTAETAADQNGERSADDSADAREKPRRQRRRGRRGGRRNREREQSSNGQLAASDEAQGEPTSSGDNASNGIGSDSIPGSGVQPDLGDLPALHGAAPQAVPAKTIESVPAKTEKTVPAIAKKAVPAAAEVADPAKAETAGPTGRARRGRPRSAGTSKSATKSDSGADADQSSTETPTPASTATDNAETAEISAEQRKGWWQRAFSSD